MKRAATFLAVAGLAAGLLVPATAAAASGPKFTPLTLQNGWTGGPSGTAQPAVALVAGVVTFRGAVANGDTPVIATLPAADTPAAWVSLHTGLLDGTDGEVDISPQGEVEVFATGPFSNAQAFTSLDGLSFTRSEKGAKPLTLENGWTNAPFGTSNLAVRTIAGVVRLQGAVAGGTSDVIAVLPKAYRPKDFVIAQTDLCGGVHGTIAVTPTGEVSVVQDDGQLTTATCQTSLDGVNWLKADSKGNVKAFALQNGWQTFSAKRAAGLHATSGFVRFEGTIHNGTTNVVGTIPTKDAPANVVYIPVDVCGPDGGGQGRVVVDPSGVVSVQPASGNLIDAQCQISFDGTWFAR